MTVDYYFIISDYVLDRFNGQKLWHANSDSNELIDFNSIPYTVSRRYAYYSDKIIACKDKEMPIYLKIVAIPIKNQ